MSRTTGFLLPSCLFLALCLSSTRGTAQTASPQDRQVLPDTPAQAILNKALDAFGGSASIAAVNSVEVDGQVSTDASHTFRWLLSGKQRRLDQVSGGSTTSEIASLSGAWRSSGRTVAVIPPHAEPTIVVPGVPAIVLLALLHDQRYVITALPGEEIGGIPVDVLAFVQLADPIRRDGSAQRWYFDRVTGLPLRCKLVQFNRQNYQQSTERWIDFSSWAQHSGVMFPEQVNIGTETADHVTHLQVTSVRINPSVPDAEFQVNGGAQ